jgi:hypothetical protein
MPVFSGRQLPGIHYLEDMEVFRGNSNALHLRAKTRTLQITVEKRASLNS